MVYAPTGVFLGSWYKGYFAPGGNARGNQAGAVLISGQNLGKKIIIFQIRSLFILLPTYSDPALPDNLGQV